MIYILFNCTEGRGLKRKDLIELLHSAYLNKASSLQSCKECTLLSMAIMGTSYSCRKSRILENTCQTILNSEDDISS